MSLPANQKGESGPGPVEDEVADEQVPNELPGSEGKKRRARLRPNLPLPSKLRAENQLQMLKTYVIESKRGAEPADFKKVAQLMQVHPTGVSSAKEFWQDIGALTEASRGLHTPSQELLAWASAYDFNKPEANRQLHVLFDRTWIGETVRKAFSVKPSLRRDGLEAILASTTGGEKVETQPRVYLLVDLLLETDYVREAANGELELAALPVDPPLGTLGTNPNLLVAPTAPENVVVATAKFALPTAVAGRSAGTPAAGAATPANLTIQVSSEHWPVADVIRLVRFLQTGTDGDA